MYLLIDAILVTVITLNRQLLTKIYSDSNKTRQHSRKILWRIGLVFSMAYAVKWLGYIWLIIDTKINKAKHERGLDTYA